MNSSDQNENLNFT